MLKLLYTVKVPLWLYIKVKEEKINFVKMLVKLHFKMVMVRQKKSPVIRDFQILSFNS
jgi:hypothetical protein